ncbi:hypothetical protein KCTC52924_00952 [Arenibacter antarcticus]|uniref:Uncharacterized protein n=1 Tax=Arenibacter antarcticus TaxID=2040469 RepID=A0ABW5VC05_9FLAO|nr:hypothetical protein [Arenibacter sp. H213]MCM4167549.1 hypothetical protein [Arenibacter sp. H213]
MRNLNKLTGVFLLGIFLTLNVACSKDNDGPADQLGGESTMTMKINGKLWKAHVATVMTVGDTEDGEDEKTYWVNMTGVKIIDDSGSEELSESISLSLLLSGAEFNRPKKSYPVGSISNNQFGYGIIIYNEVGSESEGKGVYVSMHPEDSEQQIGNFTVKDFEIGDQNFLGQQLGKGYTRLSGTFEAELYSYDGTDTPPKKLTITEGKFNLRPLLGFGV